jgi:hypothetical protein
VKVVFHRGQTLNLLPDNCQTLLQVFESLSVVRRGFLQSPEERSDLIERETEKMLCPSNLLNGVQYGRIVVSIHFTASLEWNGLDQPQALVVANAVLR